MTSQTEMPERIWAKVKTFSRFYGVNRETEERREWCESYATPEIAYICGAVEYTRADISDAKDKRIAELEANLAKAVEIGLEECPFWDGSGSYNEWWQDRHTTLAELKGQNDDQ